MRAHESVKLSNIAATTAAFILNGGDYMLLVVATFGGGNVVLEALGPNGSTWLPIHTALTANGVTGFSIPPGQYRLAITTATGVYVGINRIPGE